MSFILTGVSMKQFLFTVLLFLSSYGLFATVPYEATPAGIRGLHSALPKPDTILTKDSDHRGPRGHRGKRGKKGERGKKGHQGATGASFVPAFGQGLLLLNDPTSEPIALPIPLNQYPFLVPIDTPAPTENMTFNSGSHSFTIATDGVYSVDYFVKVFGLALDPGFSDFGGQLDLAVKVNNTFFGHAKIAQSFPASQPMLGPVPPVEVRSIMSALFQLNLQLSAGDIVSLYIFSPPEVVSTGHLFDVDPPVQALSMIFGAPTTGPDTVGYLKLQKIS